MSVQSIRARISQGYENLGALFDTVDAFLAVDQREEEHAAELESGDILGTPLSLLTDLWANPIYSRWFIDAVNIWERYKDTIDCNCAHQTKSSSDSLGDRSSSSDKQQISHDSESLQEEANSVVGPQGNNDSTIISITREEEAEAEPFEPRYILDNEDETEHLTQSGDEKDEQASDFSGPVASSCEVCTMPDNDSMLMCENTAIHKDGESWYHFICVGLSVERIPRGTWYCPPCQSKMWGESEPSDLSHSNNGDFKMPRKQKHSKESTRKRPKDSGNKCRKAQPKSKEIEKSQESLKESKQTISKEADDITKKPGKSTISKNRWKDPTEEQKVAELVREYQNDPTVPEKDKYGEAKWRAIGAMLLERHGYDRTADSIKCKFARKIRKSANYDERSDKKKNPDRMQTSVESPEKRKRKRQEKAQASGELLLMRKRVKRQSREEEEAQEDIHRINVDQDLVSSNTNQEDLGSNVHEGTLDRDGFNEFDSRNFERHLPPQFQQFDWSPSKNKGKRKRDGNDDEQASERHAQMPRSS